jgi:UTP--glucose-1-phosphate uridylyltransferase
VKIKKAIFPVAGMGTRMLPATKVIPKEMLPLVDKPILQYAFEEAQAAGIEEFIFVNSAGKTAIEDHFDAAPYLKSVLAKKQKHNELEALKAIETAPGQISVVRQPYSLGLGHAVWCARQLIKDDYFAVLLPDDVIQSDTPCLQQMCAAFEKNPGNMVATMEVATEHVSRYGIIKPGTQINLRTHEILNIVEKPQPEQAPSRMAAIGRYILSPEIFKPLDDHQQGAGGEIQLTDALASLIGTVPFYGFCFEGKRFDCGTKMGLLDANIAFALSREDTRLEAENILKKYR